MTETERDREFVKDYCPKSDPCKGCYRDFDDEQCGLCDNYLEALAWSMRGGVNDRKLKRK